MQVSLNYYQSLNAKVKQLTEDICDLRNTIAGLTTPNMPNAQSLKQLSDTLIHLPQNGQHLIFKGGVWVNSDASFSDSADVDFITVAPAKGDVLAYNGVNWVPKEIEGGMLVAEGNGYKIKTNPSTSIADGSVSLIPDVNYGTNVENALYVRDSIIRYGSDVRDGNSVPGTRVISSLLMPSNGRIITNSMKGVIVAGDMIKLEATSFLNDSLFIGHTQLESKSYTRNIYMLGGLNGAPNRMYLHNSRSYGLSIIGGSGNTIECQDDAHLIEMFGCLNSTFRVTQRNHHANSMFNCTDSEIEDPGMWNTFIGMSPITGFNGDRTHYWSSGSKWSPKSEENFYTFVKNLKIVERPERDYLTYTKVDTLTVTAGSPGWGKYRLTLTSPTTASYVDGAVVLVSDSNGVTHPARVTTDPKNPGSSTIGTTSLWVYGLENLPTGSYTDVSVGQEDALEIDNMEILVRNNDPNADGRVHIMTKGLMEKFVLSVLSNVPQAADDAAAATAGVPVGHLYVNPADSSLKVRIA